MEKFNKRNLLFSTLGMMKQYFAYNLSAAMAYRTSFLLQVFGMALNNASFAFFWKILIDQVGSIGGYGFKEVMMLWAISSSGFGLSVIVFGNALHLNDVIMKGELDTYLLQPKSVLLSLISSKTRVSGWGDLLYGFVLIFLIFGLDISSLLLFVLYSIVSGVIFTCILIISQSLTFFIGNASAISTLVFQFTITFSIYPETIYGGAIKVILYTLVPVGFMTFIPVRVMNDFSLGYALLPLVAAALLVLLSSTIFKWGLKRYESGNLMVTKM